MRPFLMVLALASLAPRPAACDDWIRRPHVWVAGHLDGFLFGDNQGDLQSRVPDATGGYPILGLGYEKKNGAELGVGYNTPRDIELQILYARTPLNFGGDSLAGGRVHLADATAHCALAGVSWSGHFHFDKWGPLGDGLASVGVLLGLSRIEDVRLTPAATAIGVTRIANRTSFTWGIDTRLDQRFYRGVVGSMGFRVLSAARALRVETDSGSDFRSADAAFATYVVRFGLGYWF